MSLTLLAPVSLAAAASRLARQQIRLPGLEALVAGAASEASDRPLDAIAGAMLGIRGDDSVPIAPLRLATENGVSRERVEGSWWLCADPVVTALRIDDAEVASRVGDLAHDEAGALVDALNAALGDDSLEFIAPDPSRWYLRCACAPRLSTTPLWQAIGRSMRRALPAGHDGATWRARLNEAQMVLHAHPVNTARETRGAQRVDSLWLWGGGRWPVFDAPQLDRIVGGPPWMRAAANASGIRTEAQAEGLDAVLLAGAARTLCVLSDDWEAARGEETTLAEWDRRWFSPLARALETQTLAGAALRFAADAGSLWLHCSAPARGHWRRWLGRTAKAPARTLEESLREIGQ